MQLLPSLWHLSQVLSSEPANGTHLALMLTQGLHALFGSRPGKSERTDRGSAGLFMLVVVLYEVSRLPLRGDRAKWHSRVGCMHCRGLPIWLTERERRGHTLACSSSVVSARVLLDHRSGANGPDTEEPENHGMGCGLKVPSHSFVAVKRERTSP